jgi:hypothetical protein
MSPRTKKGLGIGWLILGFFVIVCLSGVAIFTIGANILYPPELETQIAPVSTVQAATVAPASSASLTPSLLPAPIDLTGSGDATVKVDKWTGPALLKITHDGSGNFKVYNLDSRGERINLLVFTSGAYDNVLPLDFVEGQQTASFQITANGSWELQVIPLGALRTEKIPGTISGHGDDVILLQGDGSPASLTVDASQATQAFTIYGLGGTTQTLVDENAPYAGTVSLNSDLRVLVVKASGPWRLDVTVK